VAESPIDAAEEDLRIESGVFNLREWAGLTKDVRAAAGVPWLRRHGAEIHTVDLDRGIQRPATEDEKATGRYFKDHASFQAAN